MEHTFESLLSSAGTFRHYRGYRYLYQSVILVVEVPEKLCHICLEVYQPVAEKNHTSMPNVQKDIRTLLSSFWNHGGDQSFLKWTGCDRWKYDKPYPKKFIAVLAQILRETDTRK